MTSALEQCVRLKYVAEDDQVAVILSKFDKATARLAELNTEQVTKCCAVELDASGKPHLSISNIPLFDKLKREKTSLTQKVTSIQAYLDAMEPLAVEAAALVGGKAVTATQIQNEINKIVTRQAHTSNPVLVAHRQQLEAILTKMQAVKAPK